MMNKIVALMTILFFAGCATHDHHRETTTTTYEEDDRDLVTKKTTYEDDADVTVTKTTYEDNDNIDDESVSRTETVTEETTTQERGHTGGVIGSVFHVIGKILAFPFKVIAGALEAIF